MNKIEIMKKSPRNSDFSEFLPRLPPNPHPKQLCKIPKPTVPDISILTDESHASLTDDTQKYKLREERILGQGHKLCEEIDDARIPYIEKRLQQLLRICTASKPASNVFDNSCSSIEGARYASDVDESNNNGSASNGTTEFSDDDTLFREDESFHCDKNEDGITNCNTEKNLPSSIHSDHLVNNTKRLSKVHGCNCARENVVATSEYSNIFLQEEYLRKSNISSSSQKGKMSTPVKQSTTSVPEFSFVIPRVQQNISTNKNYSRSRENKSPPKRTQDFTTNSLKSSILYSRKMNDETEFSFEPDDKTSSDTFSTQIDSVYDYLSATTRQYLKKHGVVKQTRVQPSHRLIMHHSDIEESENEELDSLYNELNYK